MSVNRSDWIVIGANIGMKHYDDDNCEAYDELSDQDTVGEMTYLIDGMSGEYFIVGEVVAADTDGYNGFPITELPILQPRIFDEKRDRVAKFIESNFGIEVEPKLIVLTHWT